MKQNTLRVLFFVLKSRLLKNGEAPIILRVTIDGQQDEVRIQRSVPLRNKSVTAPRPSKHTVLISAISWNITRDGTSTA